MRNFRKWTYLYLPHWNIFGPIFGWAEFDELILKESYE